MITEPMKQPKVEMFRCGNCNNQFDRTESKTMPFCSLRCQQLDLRNWLNESYGLPHEGGPEGFDYTDDDEIE